jgi:hypothetical protein
MHPPKQRGVEQVHAVSKNLIDRLLGPLGASVGPLAALSIACSSVNSASIVDHPIRSRTGSLN